MATLQVAPTRHCNTEQFGGILTNQYLPTNTYLAHNSRGREGWEKTKAQNAMQTASYCNNTLRRTASNCVYKSRGAPARGIGPPLV